MERKDVQKGILSAWVFISDLELGDTISKPGVLEVNEEFRRLALSEDALYEEIYTLGLELSHYNFRLADYSFFQFSWSASSGPRYGYYPNPFRHRDFGRETRGRLEDLVAIGDLSVEEYLSILGDRYVTNSCPPIRYEFSPSSYEEFVHPASHLHIGHGDLGRWPLCRTLSPDTFVMMVTKYVYPHAWNKANTTPANRLEKRLIEKRSELPSLGEKLFTTAESASFHFT